MEDIDLEKEFVQRERSAALRDLGFNEKCMAYHGKHHWIHNACGKIVQVG
jgi:hypothetical protein